MTKQMNAGPGAVIEMRGQVVQDLKSLVADSESWLKREMDASGEELSAVGARIDDRLGEAKGRLIAARVATGRSMGDAADFTRAYVVDNPWRVLGLTALAGLVIGAMLRGR